MKQLRGFAQVPDTGLAQRTDQIVARFAITI
jgi:hypothetical protein